MEKLNGMQKEFQILNPLLINMSGKESNIRQIEMIGKLLRKIIQKLLLIFCILKKKKKKNSPAYISKINWNCEKQIILLIIITNGEKKAGIILQ